MKVHGIIQARLGSTRLPGKVFLDLDGKNLLERVIERSKKSKKIDQIIVATTTNPNDDQIAKFCEDNCIFFHRGSEKDVLDRYVQTAKKFGSDIVVRITSDNPFGEPTLFDELIQKNIKEKLDYIFSVGFPLGASCEVFNFQSLDKVNQITDQASYHEHLGTYFLDHKQDFDIGSLKAPKSLQYPSIRLTVDTQKDLQTATNLFENLPEDFSLENIIILWNSKNELFTNKEVQQYYPTENIKRIFAGEDI